MKHKIRSDNLVLGALMSGPMHGYEIMKFLEENLSFAWSLSTSQLYSLLGRLGKNSFIKGSLIAQDTRPSKRVFSITDKGRETFMEWLKSPCIHVRDMRVEFFAKLFFIKKLFPETGKNLLNNQKRMLYELKKELLSRANKEKDPFRRLVFRYRYIIINSTINWLEKDVADFIRP